MKIGIIVHSHTGHTLSVAQQLQERFVASGHTVLIERVEASNDSEANIDSILLIRTPIIKEYDMLVFGAPVRGFMLSPVMQAYLRRLPSLQGKIVAGFVTQSFPKPTMGGIQAIKCFTEICRSKEAEVSKTGIVNWLFPSKRKKLVAEVIDNITKVT